ncbi:hypothetical protein CW304_28780 [Bacillus sp. UFRGS-B20]|nr:hypothetical protein CW304_28780 [Bacillus sp. UFRGS-B20]
MSVWVIVEAHYLLAVDLHLWVASLFELLLQNCCSWHGVLLEKLKGFLDSAQVVQTVYSPSSRLFSSSCCISKFVLSPITIEFE